MNLDISKITSYGSDWEINRYTLLKTIKSWQTELSKNRIYPALEYSRQLKSKFNILLEENIESKGWLDKEVRGAFVDDHLVVLEKAHQISYQLEKLIEFVKWGLKINRDLLNEANIIRKFVYDEINIIAFSDTNKYRGKGYILIPDNKKRVYNIYLYELSISWTVEDPIEYLELELLRSMPYDLVDCSAEDLIEQFLQQNKILYDPMVYICKTELDFPFNETILPIIKDKLLEVINGYTPYL